MSADEVRERVERRLREAVGPPDARAAVTFIGTGRIEVLRIPDPGQGLVRYATSGMSALPMTDPTAAVADPDRGPRAELLLTLRAGRARTDAVHRALAVFAASPQVEGVVLAAGGSLDLGEPLWPGAPFTSVLAGEPGAVVPELPLPPPRDPVRFFPLLPMTPNEAAWKRVHGAAALEERWLHHGTDLRDPARAAVPLGE
ncbi:suppressor of fused domain protein [Streptomyces sp. MP131-18]|uniref:suppressor of fused domain protein n=1 Tax=Streptomyces sp. MP131-18 TaxID=1857892 RepID=UPI00097C0F86|nr:suppressor of fused domain protein [Streptomyces sp. MP131-18]ONK11582.1 Suppressor of fused protein (SUFU) [Streptomyces sp. MP131-18]